MAGDLRPAWDLIKAQPPGIQLQIIEQLAKDLEREQIEDASVQVDKTVADIRTAVPGIDIEDASRLLARYERTKSGRPELP